MSGGFDGPASAEDKALHKALKERNLPVPAALGDRVVARSKRDKLGQIQVRNISGLVGGPAVKVLTRFEEQIGGRHELEEKLGAIEERLSHEERALLAVLRTGEGKRKSLARLVAELGASPLSLIKAYAEGAKELGKLEAAIEAARHQPGIVKDLVRHALDQTPICQICVGTGKVKARANGVSESEGCPGCEGRGYKIIVSPKKEYAMSKLIDMNEMMPKQERAPLFQLQQNVGVKMGGSGGNGGTFFEKTLRTSDQILYGRRKSADAVVDAEVVGEGVPDVGEQEQSVGEPA